jgi:integrase
MTEKIADKLVKELQAPKTGNRITYDTDIKGFGVRVTAAGAKAFILNYRTSGRERRITIGAYPVWSVAAAREEAKQLKRQVDRGEDPMGQRHTNRAAPTVKDLTERYIDEHLPKKRPSSRRDDQVMIYQIVLPRMGKLKVADVRHTDVDRLHREITKRAPYRANRCAALLSKMFSLAIKWEMRPDNPAKGIERNQEQKRTRYLLGDELGRLTAALAEHPEQTSANAVRLLLLTGARRGEVLSATWDQFDLEAGVWTKPSAHTKQKSEHRVPLSAPAIQLLSDMKVTSTGICLFPGKNPDKPLTEIKHFWATICRKADIKDCRLHDLRHTYASILASAGLSLPIIGALLGHTQPNTTARYSHLFDDPLRQATERVGAVVTAAGNGKTAEVVNLRDDGAA